MSICKYTILDSINKNSLMLENIAKYVHNYRFNWEMKNKKRDDFILQKYEKEEFVNECKEKKHHFLQTILHVIHDCTTTYVRVRTI